MDEKQIKTLIKRIDLALDEAQTPGEALKDLVLLQKRLEVRLVNFQKRLDDLKLPEKVKVEVDNPVTEVRVSNLGEMPEFPSQIKVSNLKEIPASVINIPKEVDILKPRWLEEVLKRVLKDFTIQQLAEAVAKSLPKEASDAISVRLSDGEQFYKALDTIVQEIKGGGGGSNPFQKANSEPRPALIDDDRHVQVDVVTLPDVTVNASDIQIGAVEIKDATTATRATVDANGLHVQTNHGITGIGDGRKIVTAAGTRETLASSTTVKKVDIQALLTNTNPVVIGSSTVVAAAGTRRGVALNAGDVYSLEIDNLADIYIDAVTSGEGVSYTYYV